MKTIVTAKSQIKFQSRVGKIEFYLKFPAGGFSNLGGPLGAASQINVNISHMTPSGSVPIIQNVTLAQIFEMSLFDGGKLFADGYGLAGMFELCRAGSYPVNGVNYITVELDGTFTGIEVHVSPIDFNETSNTLYVYDKIIAESGVYKEIDVSNGEYLVLPATALVDVELTYSNGRRVLWSKDEIIALNRDLYGFNRAFVDETYCASTTKASCIASCHFLPVSDAVTCRVNYTANTIVTKITPKIFQ
jgi:hypothetical protein